MQCLEQMEDVMCVLVVGDGLGCYGGQYGVEVVVEFEC